MRNVRIPIGAMAVTGVHGARTHESIPFGWRAWLALGVGAVAAVLFAMFASEVIEREATAVDVAVRRWIQDRRTPLGDAAFAVLTWGGTIGGLLLVSLAAAGLLWRRAGNRAAAFVLLAPLAAALIIPLLKGWFRLERPPGLAASSLGYGFPSGHATASSAVLTVLAYVLLREGIGPRVLLPGAVTIAFFVGVSRVYLDVHWASDVLGGWAAGIVLIACCISAYERMRT